RERRAAADRGRAGVGGGRSRHRHAPHPGGADHASPRAVAPPGGGRAPGALAAVLILLPDRVEERAGAVPAPLHPPEFRVPRARFRPATGVLPAEGVLPAAGFRPRLAVLVVLPVPGHVHVVPVPLMI